MVGPAFVYLKRAPDVLTITTRTPNYTDNVLNIKISALVFVFNYRSRSTLMQIRQNWRHQPCRCGEGTHYHV